MTAATVSIASRIVVDRAAEHVDLAELALVEGEQDAAGDVLDVGHADAELGERQQRQFPGEEFVEQVGDLRGVAGAVDAAGLDDHAGRSSSAIIRLAIRCASSLVSS